MSTTSRHDAYEALHAALDAATRAAEAVHAEALDDKEEATARELTFAIRLIAADAFDLDVEGTRARRKDRRDAWRRRQEAAGNY